jgi:uncharacterized membrane protein
MHHIEEVMIVDRPVSTVYNQWTQFKEFPAFMSGVEEVRQLDDNHLHWKAKVWGREKEWDAEITEQEPDRRITWKSTSGAHNAGTVRFRSTMDGKTEVRLVMAYEPDGAAEKLGSSLGVMRSRVAKSLLDFKHFLEQHLSATGGWRGAVVHGEPYKMGTVPNS